METNFRLCDIFVGCLLNTVDLYLCLDLFLEEPFQPTSTNKKLIKMLYLVDNLFVVLSRQIIEMRIEMDCKVFKMPDTQQIRSWTENTHINFVVLIFGF